MPQPPSINATTAAATALRMAIPALGSWFIDSRKTNAVSV
jgi:hypothetical protein